MAKTKTNYPPNDLTRREATRKDGECQLCRKKVPLKDQYTVENDLEATPPAVVRKKNAARKGAEKASHYCQSCSDKRIAQKAAWIKSVHGVEAKLPASYKPPKASTSGSGSAKKASGSSGSKAKGKASASAKKDTRSAKAKNPKGAAKVAAAKPKAKAAVSTEEPF